MIFCRINHRTIGDATVEIVLSSPPSPLPPPASLPHPSPVSFPLSVDITLGLPLTSLPAPHTLLLPRPGREAPSLSISCFSAPAGCEAAAGRDGLCWGRCVWLGNPGSR